MSKEITVYTASELKSVNQKGFERAHALFARDAYEYAYTSEIVESFSKFLEAFDDLEVKDFCLDYANYTSVKLVARNFLDFSGKRALAWVENNLLYKLRNKRTKKNLKSMLKYREKDGYIRACPFTGYFSDDCILNAFIKSIRNRNTIADAIDDAACEAALLIQKEYDYCETEEFFIEDSENQGAMFLENGTRVE